MAAAVNDTPQVKPILVHFSRLESGVFELQSGDIYRAHCCEAMSGDPKKGLPTVPVFRHDNKLWTNGGGCHSPYSCSATCYQLISPEDYHGPDTVPYSYEGRTVLYQKRPHRLGPKTEFCSIERTISEYRGLLRRMYERGGYFTSGKTYHGLLREELERERWDKGAFAKPKGNIVTAIKLELKTPNFDKWKVRKTVVVEHSLLQPELL